MDETYIILEEDNERKILLEGQEIKDAHREAEKRYRHLVDPPAGGAGLEALRQAFLHRADPKSADEQAPDPEIPAGEPSPEEPEPPEEPPAEPVRQQMSDSEEKPIEEQVRDLIEKYKAQRPEANPGTENARPEIPFTVLKESEVEILDNAGTEKKTPGENSSGGTGRHISALWAAAGIFLLCLLCIYFLWK